MGGASDAPSHTRTALLIVLCSVTTLTTFILQLLVRTDDLDQLLVMRTCQGLTCSVSGLLVGASHQVHLQLPHWLQQWFRATMGDLGFLCYPTDRR